MKPIPDTLETQKKPKPTEEWLKKWTNFFFHSANVSPVPEIVAFEMIRMGESTERKFVAKLEQLVYTGQIITNQEAEI